MTSMVCRRSLLSGPSLHLDRKYLIQISGSLRNFTQKDRDFYNCSCNLCGDSQKNKLKARMFFYVGKNQNLMVYCHNCGISMAFRNYLQKVNPSKFREYVFERITEGRQTRTIIEEEVEEVKAPASIEQAIKFELLTPVSKLPKDHLCRKYVEVERQIPQERWDSLYYCDNFWTDMNPKPPADNKKVVDYDPRLVWFNTDLDGNMNQICGRSLLADPEIRYQKFKLNKESERRIYGMHSIKDWSKPIYVVEGEIDAMMLDNTIASGDSSLKNLAEAFAVKFQDKALKLVLIFDNQPRNKEIVKAVASAIRAGHWVMIWHDMFEDLKDINKVFTEGFGDALKASIPERSYKGLEAWLRFNEWKKVDIE